MLTTISKSTSLPPRQAESGHPSPRFRGLADTAARQGATGIANYEIAKRLETPVKWLAKLANNKDAGIGGLSLEDMAARLQTAIGVYLLQGYYAVKEDKHPWETNGRNVLVWLMTFAVTAWTKSENYGVNPLVLNTFMKQKGAAANMFCLPMPRKLADNFRMNVDYLDIIEKAGIKLKDEEKEGALKGKKALWAASWLDANKIEKIENYHRSLEQKLLDAVKDHFSASSTDFKKLADLHKNSRGDASVRKELQKLLPEKVGELLKKSADKEVEAMAKMYTAIPQFFKRINLFNVTSTALLMAATVYLIGVLAMRIVNKFISPLDKDFDGHKPGAKPIRPPFMQGQPPMFTPPAPLRPQVMPPQNMLQNTMIFPPPGHMMPGMVPQGQGGLN